MKLGKMLLLKTREQLFFGKFSVTFGQFSENLKINRKPWGNDFGPFREK